MLFRTLAHWDRPLRSNPGAFREADAAVALGVEVGGHVDAGEREGGGVAQWP